MAKKKRLCNGIRALVAVYKKCLHPRKEVCAKYPSANKGDVLNGLLVLRTEEKKGFSVDDNNEPGAPENIPEAEDKNIEDCEFFAWGKTLDERRKAGVREVKPLLVNHANETLHTLFGYFVHFLPVSFIKMILKPTTSNASLSKPLTWEDFLRFPGGLIFVMATTQGVARTEFWANDDVPDIFCGAPFCLHNYMSRRRFELILKHLKFTLDDPPPPFKHLFHAVNQLIDAFNSHTQACFSPGWVNCCLDESMSVWTNQYTCPGWMFVPRKPHPWGMTIIQCAED